RLMAVVEYGGALTVKQNFTANAKLLEAAVSRAHAPNIESNPQSDSQTVDVASLGTPSFGLPSMSAAASFGARNMLLSIRDLAKNLRAVPGRKMLIVFSAGHRAHVRADRHNRCLQQSQRGRVLGGRARVDRGRAWRQRAVAATIGPAECAHGGTQGR